MEAKQIKDLMEAYASIVSPSESEGELVDEGLGAKAAELLDRGTKAIQSSLEKAGVPINRQKRGTVTKAEQESRIRDNVKEESDVFDLILEYLVAEGYADTNQSALVIMANMSEEWKKSIVEQDLTAEQKYLMKKVGDMNAQKSGSAHTAIPGKQSAGGALDRANRSAMQMRGV